MSMVGSAAPWTMRDGDSTIGRCSMTDNTVHRLSTVLQISIAPFDPQQFIWFNGRGVWVYSRLYRLHGRRPEHLQIAKRAFEFILRLASLSSAPSSSFCQEGKQTPSRRHNRDKHTGEWLVETNGDGTKVTLVLCCVDGLSPACGCVRCCKAAKKIILPPPGTA